MDNELIANISKLISNFRADISDNSRFDERFNSSRFINCFKDDIFFTPQYSKFNFFNLTQLDKGVISFILSSARQSFSKFIIALSGVISITLDFGKFNFFKLVKFDKRLISDMLIFEKSNSSKFFNPLIFSKSSTLLQGKFNFFNLVKLNKGEISEIESQLIFNISKLVQYYSFPNHI